MSSKTLGRLLALREVGLSMEISKAVEKWSKREKVRVGATFFLVLLLASLAACLRDVQHGLGDRQVDETSLAQTFFSASDEIMSRF
jgi:hypothetical protein